MTPRQGEPGKRISGDGAEGTTGALILGVAAQFNANKKLSKNPDVRVRPEEEKIFENNRPNNSRYS